MRFILILTGFILFWGCSPQWHLERSSQHVKKAIDKGAIISKDTVYVSGDTITNSYIKNDTVYITNTIKEVKFLQGEVRYITKKDKRVERKRERRKEKYDFKLRKQEIKTERKRSLWFIWFILGVISTLLIKQLYNKYFRFYLRR